MENDEGLNMTFNIVFITLTTVIGSALIFPKIYEGFENLALIIGVIVFGLVLFFRKKYVC